MIVAYTEGDRSEIRIDRANHQCGGSSMGNRARRVIDGAGSRWKTIAGADRIIAAILASGARQWDDYEFVVEECP
jgi:hypothetical protein